MPRISYFYGISIYMYYRDHAPPHFHAVYGGDQAEIGIADRALLKGGLPPRALRMVQEWAADHSGELMQNWDIARQQKPLNLVEPLS